jgi:GNAT superfamily N-acetyltransferase
VVGVKLTLRHVTDPAQALALAARLDAAAAEFNVQFSDDTFPKGASERFLRRHFDAPQTVLVVAEAEPRGEPLGVCLVGPLTDPLIGATLPLVLVLYVDPTLRHRGIAGELIQDVERILASRGIHTLAARAGHNDDALISMGERWGFVRSWELMVKE